MGLDSQIVYSQLSYESIYYQLDLTKPGTSPRIAAWRSMLRLKPNLRYTPCGRPVMRQRLRKRAALASRGCFCNATCASQRSSGVEFGLAITAFSAARFSANLATVR